jgi:hypothetical protein
MVLAGKHIQTGEMMSAGERLTSGITMIGLGITREERRP